MKVNKLLTLDSVTQLPFPKKKIQNLQLLLSNRVSKTE